MVWGIRSWLSQVVKLIVENAVEAMTEANSPTKKLTISSNCQTNFVKLCFQDTGPGIPIEVQKQLFNEQIESKKGSGMGLMITQTIIETFGGEIELENTDSFGTSIAIRLPIAETLQQG